MPIGTVKKWAAERQADPHDLKDELDQILWAIWSAREIGIESVTAAEIEKILLHGFDLHVPRQRINAKLAGSKQFAIAAGRNRPVRYRILAQGLQRVSDAIFEPLFIDPSNAFSGRRRVQALLSSLSGDISICDPYVEPATLDYVSKVPRVSRVRLLTMVINRESEFKRDVQALAAQHGGIEVRRVSSRTLHDRYIIDGESLYVLGTSLNGLGKKQSIVVQLGGDLKQALLGAFEAEWHKAAPI